MKIFYFFTTDEPEISSLKTLFKKSVPTDFILRPNPIHNQKFCKTDHGGGYLGWINKFNTIMNGFKETDKNEYFIFSDIDIIYYRSFLPDLNLIIRNQEDILFQRELVKNGINIGFMIIKNTQESINFFHKTFNIIEKLKYVDSKGCEQIKHKRGNGAGQFVINDILNKTPKVIKWSKLPTSFWSRSIGLDYLNENIYIHHANCAGTVEEKINQFIEIKDIIGI